MSNKLLAGLAGAVGVLVIGIIVLAVAIVASSGGSSSSAKSASKQNTSSGTPRTIKRKTSASHRKGRIAKSCRRASTMPRIAASTIAPAVR